MRKFRILISLDACCDTILHENIHASSFLGFHEILAIETLEGAAKPGGEAAYIEVLDRTDAAYTILQRRP
jgi:hypothetical protein